MTSRSDAMNDALERLDGYTYLDGGGFPCHGTMGAEALSALGHDDLVGPWVEAYKTRHAPLDGPPANEAIDPHDERSWRPALGDFARIADWEDVFARQLAEQGWSAVLPLWVPRLLPGYGGALTHGLIRTIHAVRSLEQDDGPSDLLLDELAKGLALWAAAYAQLPGRRELRGERTLAEALEHLPRISSDAGVTLMEAATFARLDEVPDFAASVEALGPPESVDDALSDLTAAYCRIMLAHPDTPATVPFVHTVTPVALSRTLLAHVPNLSVESLYARLWQVNAALAAGFTTGWVPAETAATATQDAPEPPTPGALSARAVEHRDPHVLKFTEACLREHAHRPDPSYLLAADRVMEASTPL